MGKTATLGTHQAEGNVSGGPSELEEGSVDVIAAKDCKNGEGEASVGLLDVAWGLAGHKRCTGVTVRIQPVRRDCPMFREQPS